MTGPQKHFHLQCVKAWQTMDGDQLIYIAMKAALDGKGLHLNQLIYTHDQQPKERQNKFWRTETIQRMKQCQHLSTKIKMWFDDEDTDGLPFSQQDVQILLELLPHLWV